MKHKPTMPPLHPGELLKEEFLDPMGITPYRLAKSIGVPAMRISNIIHGKIGVSADTALRLSAFFGMSARFWMNAQSFYELECARDRSGEKIQRDVVAHAA